MVSSSIKALTIGYNAEYSEDQPDVAELLKLSGISLVEFGAPWCSHCQFAEPIVRDAMNLYSDISHIKVYDGKGKQLGRAFQVKLWPTLILLRDGKELGRVVRPKQAEDILRLIHQLKNKER